MNFFLALGISIIAGYIFFLIIHPKEAKRIQQENYEKKHQQIRISKDGKVMCPKCGCTEIQIKNRGFKITTGFLGSGKPERVCVKCLNRF